jgi:hypothetical protein
MNKKTKVLFFSFLSLFILLFSELTYIYLFNSMSADQLLKKRTFVNIVQMPDLAIANEDYYIRHRTQSTIFDIYSNDASLRENSLLTYTISDSHIKERR